MNNKQKIVIGLFLALLCGVVLRSAFSKSTTKADASPAYAQNDWKPATPSGEQLLAAVNSRALPEGEGPDGKQVLAQGDGKTTLPQSDGKSVLPAVGENDGKTVLPPSGKEVLPPVAELIGQKPPEVDPAAPVAPPEYYESNLNKGSNPLLNPPNPVNVSGPVVSNEAR